MPETLSGAFAIQTYLVNHDINETDLATAYGLSRQQLHQILTGKQKGRKANEFILKVIHDYKTKS